jgi:hypothetical protein
VLPDPALGARMFLAAALDPSADHGARCGGGLRARGRPPAVAVSPAAWPPVRAWSLPAGSARPARAHRPAGRPPTRPLVAVTGAAAARAVASCHGVYPGTAYTPGVWLGVL